MGVSPRSIAPPGTCGARFYSLRLQVGKGEGWVEWGLRLSRNEGSVLVADGDVRERRLVAGVLRRAGYETVEVENGFDALEAARGGGIGLAVLDVSLPGLTGYEVCHELRRDSGHQLPIV